MEVFFYTFLASFILSILLGFILIPLLKKLKIGQPVYELVKEHKKKKGTPTMGGIIFVISSIAAFFIFNISAPFSLSFTSVIFFLAYFLVGFIDDFIKIKFGKNEGLKPYQKIVFQFSISLLGGAFLFNNGLTYFYIPFTDILVDFSFFTFILAVFIFVSLTNCVNLTDGLDGLSSSTTIGYLISFTLLLILQKNSAFPYLSDSEYNSLISLSLSLLGGLLGFLIFNVNKASVFMGDTGSLAIGGVLSSLSLFSGNVFFILFGGFFFVFSGISVILQVFYYKRTKKRIFLMAPFHHHLELKGISESKISYIYFAVSLLLGAVYCINYL